MQFLSNFWILWRELPHTTMISNDTIVYVAWSLRQKRGLRDDPKNPKIFYFDNFVKIVRKFRSIFVVFNESNEEQNNSRFQKKGHFFQKRHQKVNKSYFSLISTVLIDFRNFSEHLGGYENSHRQKTQKLSF